jgi:hypothetical protein
MLRLSGIALLLAAVTAHAQVPTIAADDAIEKAIRSSSLTMDGRPFHAVLEISKPSDRSSPFHGRIEVFWQGPNAYRTIIQSSVFSQSRIVNGQQVEEHNTGDFYPNWLHGYLTAILTPVPRPGLFLHANGRVALGDHMTTCFKHDDRPGGITDQLTWAQLCLTGTGPSIATYIDFTYFVELKDFDGHDPVVGKLTLLEPLSDKDRAAELTVLAPTPLNERIETAFVSTLKEESLVEVTDTSPWPPVRDGKTEGYMIVYALTDRSGQVREAYKHNSDNAELEEAGVARALHYKFKPLLIDGVPQQMEMPLVLHFSSRVNDPRPIVEGPELAHYISGCSTPDLPQGLLPKGTVFHLRFLIGEEGKVYEEKFPEANDKLKIPNELLNPAWSSLQSCKFKPYLRDGNPTEYFALFTFLAP